MNEDCSLVILIVTRTMKDYHCVAKDYSGAMKHYGSAIKDCSHAMKDYRCAEKDGRHVMKDDSGVMRDGRRIERVICTDTLSPQLRNYHKHTDGQCVSHPLPPNKFITCN